ncbi:MAG TPA: Fe-S cluster assembly protein SufD [Pyrinomonadaceae bacterium]|nr:Fe-S cluster assembly protein SufD [Pyrinomonadaceae bacterium]
MVSQIVKSDRNYQAAFLSLRETDPTAAWVQLVRDTAMDRFESLGFPSVADEEWKYTNLAPWAKSSFTPASNQSNLTRDAVKSLRSAETTNSHLVLVNGFLREDLSSKSGLDEVVAVDLFSAIGDARYSKIVREYLARNADYQDSGLVSLNTAFLRSGVFILIPKGVKLKQPIQISYVSDGVRDNEVSFPRLLLVGEENSSASLIETFISTGDAPYFTNAVAEIVLNDGAQLEHYRVQRDSINSLHIGKTATELGRGSRYDSTAITLGARLSRHDISVVLDHEGAECRVDGLYVVSSDQHADTHSVIDHKQPHCNSHQLYKGILDGNGRAVFNGKIFVREGAQKTDAIQTNKNLLLSDRARVDTKPQLEIYADDVKCAHGAAVGQISEEELFYLEARGIEPSVGRNLLTYGFAEEVIGKIKVDSIRTAVDEAVLRQLKTVLVS